MIAAGDLVRFSNEYLKKLGGRTRWRPYRKFRGKQQIAKVVQIVNYPYYRWFHGKKEVVDGVVELDVPDKFFKEVLKSDEDRNLQISTHWLRLVKKSRRTSLQDRSLIEGACRS